MSRRGALKSWKKALLVANLERLKPSAMHSRFLSSPLAPFSLLSRSSRSSFVSRSRSLVEVRKKQMPYIMIPLAVHLGCETCPDLGGRPGRLCRDRGGPLCGGNSPVCFA